MVEPRKKAKDIFFNFSVLKYPSYRIFLLQKSKKIRYEGYFSSEKMKKMVLAF